MRKPERRKRFDDEEAKFDTRKLVTYVLLLIFAAVTANVLIGADQAERSTVLQTVINFTMIAVGYWLGASKPSNGPAPVAAVAQTAAVAAVAEVAKVAGTDEPRP